MLIYHFRMIAPAYIASTNGYPITFSAQFYALATTVSKSIPYLGCAIVSAAPTFRTMRIVWIVFSAPLVTSSGKTVALF